jgi:uncharacterized protein (TIGR03067 family)
MSTLLSAPLLAALFSAAGVAGVRADEPDLKGDLAKLQGQWTATFGPQHIVVVVTIKGTAATMSFTRPDGQARESKGEIKIDEKARPNKTLDWVNFTTRSGEPAPPILGIYNLSGDSVTICNGGPGNERPTEFKAGEGGQPQLFVLTRKTAATGAAAEATSATGDLARMQGHWTAKVGANQQRTLSLTIKGTSIALTVPTRDGPQREIKGEIKIDESAQPNKTLDWVNMTRADGETAQPSLAIYKLEGRTLTICSGGPGRDRPTEFKAGERNRPSLLVLNREGK